MVHMGNAIMSFYSALIDLLGRCAPEMHVGSPFFLILKHIYSNVMIVYAGYCVVLC